MSILDQLKERRVFRVAAVYVIVAWGILQVLDVIDHKRHGVALTLHGDFTIDLALTLLTATKRRCWNPVAAGHVVR